MIYIQKHFKFISTLFIVSFTLLSSNAWAQYGNLNGTWYHNGSPTSISARGRDQYIFCNEERNCALGYFSSNKQISVPKWQVSGFLNNRNATIQWSNGTTWDRHASER